MTNLPMIVCLEGGRGTQPARDPAAWTCRVAAIQEGDTGFSRCIQLGEHCIQFGFTHHTVEIAIDAMQREGRVYMRIRTSIHSSGLDSKHYGAFLAHLAGVNALVVGCRTVCDFAGFADLTGE